jgi:hypothetical protein
MMGGNTKAYDGCGIGKPPAIAMWLLRGVGAGRCGSGRSYFIFGDGRAARTSGAGAVYGAYGHGYGMGYAYAYWQDGIGTL